MITGSVRHPLLRLFAPIAILLAVSMSLGAGATRPVPAGHGRDRASRVSRGGTPRTESDHGALGALEAEAAPTTVTAQDQAASVHTPAPAPVESGVTHAPAHLPAALTDVVWLAPLPAAPVRPQTALSSTSGRAPPRA